MFIFFLSNNLSLISCHPATGVVEDVDLDELEDDPFLENPRYKYSFNVADDEEQTYQRQAQQLEDRVRGTLLWSQSYKNASRVYTFVVFGYGLSAVFA